MACPLLTALLSDIHGNLEALNACLGHARERGAERFGFLGDLVGYGADARAVVEIVARYAAAGAVVLKGNHDEAVDGAGGYFNDAARAALQWARETLTEEQREFLASLPLIVRQETVCFVHASAAAPERWEYIDSPADAKRCADAADTCYTFCGHVHDQVLYFENAQGRMSEFRPFPGTAIPVPSHRRWVAIVGSVGQPRDRNPAAAYTLFDLAGQKLVAVDTEHPEDERHPALQAATRQLVSLYPELRLMFISVVKAPPPGEGPDDLDTRTGRHLEHKMRLRHWVEPIRFPLSRASLHVIEGANAASTLLDLARVKSIMSI